MAKATKLGAGIPKPANQGTSSVAPVQGANVQKQRGPVDPSNTLGVIYSVQPGGVGGAGVFGIPGKGTPGN